MKRWMASYPVLAFYLLAFLFSWSGWIPLLLQARGLLPVGSPLLAFLGMLLGGGGPTFAALLVSVVVDGRDGPVQSFARLFSLRASIRWYLVAFLGMPLLTTLALLSAYFFGQPLPDLTQVSWQGLPFLFLGMFFSNAWEEVGWRGFALPRLQQRYSDLVVVLLMGILAELWHLPLALNPQNPMSGLSPFLAFVFSLALTALYTWLYNHTRPSLTFVTIFHAMANTVAAILLESGVFLSSYPAVVTVTALSAILLFMVYGSQKLLR